MVTDGLGDVTQVAYLAAVSKNWGWAQAFSPQSGEGGDAGLDPGAMSYGTAAVNSMVEGVTQCWYGYGQVFVPCVY